MNLPDPEIVDGNDVVRKTALKVEQDARRARVAGFVLAMVAALAAVGGAAFAAWGAAQIRSCTVPQGSCYRQNTVRARETTRGFLEDLNRQHQSLERRFRILECVLLIEPRARAADTVAECEEKTR